MKNGWKIKSLDEIAIIKGGKRVPKGYQFESEPTLHPYITVSDFTEDGTICTENIKYISDEIYRQIKNYTISSLDIYVSIAGTIGKTGSVPYNLDGANLTENACKLVLQEGIEKKFIYYFTKTDNFIRQTGINTRIAAQPKLALIRLKTITLPVPPLSEQKRIVSIVDEAFEAIDIAIDNTKQNLTNARELFDSYLNAIFTEKGDGWVERKLGDIATLRNGINFTKNSTGESIRIVGVKDFQDNFWMQEDELAFVKVDGELKEIDTLHENDILTVRSNGSKELIGRCILVGDLSEKTSHSGFTIRIRVERKDIYPPFIVHFLKSKELRKQLTASGGGISISSINQQGLSLIELSFPAFEKQKAIVAEIDKLAIETQRLESIYQQKLTALNELKQSILHKAFTGELTADKAEVMTNIEHEAIAV